MAKLIGELQADNGDVLYAHTMAKAVFMNDGKALQTLLTDFLNSSGNLAIPWSKLTGVPSSFAPASHNHNSLYPSMDSFTAVNNGVTLLQESLGIAGSKWRDNTDFNTIIEYGRYRCGGGVNSPCGTGGGVCDLEVMPVQSGILHQRVTYVYGGNTGRIFSRVLKDTGWGQWTELMTQANTSNQNLVINGCFQIWQRGTSFALGASGNRMYTADRWIGYTDGSATVQKQGNGIKCRLTGGTWFKLTSVLEDATRFKGKHMTISFISNGTKIVVPVYWNGYFVQTPVDGMTVNYGQHSDNFFFVEIYIQTLNKDYIISDFKLEMGMAATAFSPRPYADELAMCKRYYQKFPKESTRIPMLCSYTDVAFYMLNISEMRIPPTFSGVPCDLYNTVGNMVNASSKTLTTNVAWKDAIRFAITGLPSNIQSTYVVPASDIILDSEIY